MPNHIVCIGEALVDMIEVERGDQPRYLAAWGGSVLNVAVGAARLGSEVEFAGSFASDALGNQLYSFLEREGVGLALSQRVDAQTAIAMTSFDGAEPRYTFYAQPASYGFLPPAIGARQQVASASVVHAGSLGVLESLTFDAMMESFQATSGVTTCDPNVRPGLVTDWDEYRRRLGALIGHSDVVKFSQEDIQAAYPGQSDERIAMATLEGRAKAVVITRAGQPVTIYTEADQSDLPLPGALEIRDTTGGGDAAMAAIVHQIALNGLPHTHSEWLRVIGDALVVAALACSRTGGAMAMPTGAEAVAAGVTW